ncbi:WD40-repeat-containing domain protein, partial [Flammula alnicola]
PSFMLNRPTELSQTDAQPSNLTTVNPKSKSQHGIQPLRCPILLDVPVETLTGITSYLDPPSLFALATVNKYLGQHVGDDNTWRRAFVQQFLGIGPESDLDDEKTLLLRRSERSWRNEFISHYTLIRRWERSRNVTIAHVPVHSIISGMRLMPSDTLLTSSIEYGIVGRSVPLTGKVLSGYLDASGTRAGLGVGNPNAEFTPNVSACAMTSDGGTAKIVWGSRVGHLLFMTAPRAMETSRRSAADVRRCNVTDEHEGAVLDVQWIDAQGGWVLSGGADGRVKLWNTKTITCPWSSEKILNSFVPDPCVKVAASTQHGCVAVVLQSGEIHVWIGIEFGTSTPLFNSIKEIVIQCPIRTTTEGYDAQAAHGVTALHVDPTNASPTLLVAYQNDPYFYRIRIDAVTGHVETIAFGDPFFGSTSVVVPFFRSEVEQRTQQSSFVFVGDHIGCISLYAWDVDASHVNGRTGAVNPVRKFEAHKDGSSVSAISWNGLTLITGSARGVTHVWDALTFAHLRSFVTPVPRLRGRAVHPGIDLVERESVRHIIVSQEKDVLFVGVGDRVMAWRAGPVPKNNKTGGVRGRHTSGVLGKKKSSNAKYIGQIEMNETIIESRDLLYDKSDKTRRVYGREKEHRARLDSLGLSEVEAVEYVL